MGNSMIAAILIVLAAICNSIMDKISHHFSTSIFKNLNQDFWNPNVSWKVAKRIFGWKYDAWHVFKSTMIVALCLAVVLHEPALKWYYEILIAGAVWNGTFNLFYNRIFASK
jgi:hypothetical protein